MTNYTRAKPETMPPRLPGAAAQSPDLRDLGALLRIAFAAVEAAPLPDRLLVLLEQLGRDDPEQPGPGSGGSPGAPPGALGDKAFKSALAAVIPHLRAYGRSLSGSADLADDLVQETMLKA